MSPPHRQRSRRLAKVEKEEKTEEEKKASLKETNEYEKTASYIAEIGKGLGLPECSVKTLSLIHILRVTVFPSAFIIIPSRDGIDVF